MEAQIRRAAPSDLAAFVRLAAECFERPWGEPALAGALALPLARAWLVERSPRAERGAGAGAESRAQGFVLARRIAELLEVDLVAVAPAARRLGLARGLLERALEAELAQGLVEARLELSSGNRAAAELYRGLGFMVVGRRPRYYPDGSDALLLSRRFE